MSEWLCYSLYHVSVLWSLLISDGDGDVGDDDDDDGDDGDGDEIKHLHILCCTGSEISMVTVFMLLSSVLHGNWLVRFLRCLDSSQRTVHSVWGVSLVVVIWRRTLLTSTHQGWYIPAECTWTGTYFSVLIAGRVLMLGGLLLA